MSQTIAERLTVDVIGGHHFVFAPSGSGEAVLLHLAAHGVQPVTRRAESLSFDRLELGNAVDAVAVQAILDEWPQ